MRILITGVSGQVGGALIARLHKQEVIAADRSIIDLAHPKVIPSVLEKLNPELIINAAAYTAVDQAEDHRELAHLINAVAPGAIAQWASTKGIPLIHFSTDYVFDGRGQVPWREDDATGPLSVYGQTKLDGENAVRAAGAAFLIVRTSWVYSATGNSFLRTIARLARERAQLRIVADQIGAPTSAALIADCLARMLYGTLESIRNRCVQSSGIVHLAASGETSWYGFACAIVEGLRARGVNLVVEKIDKIRSDEYPTAAKRPRNSRLDLTRLHQVFKIEPVHWRDPLDRELDALAEVFR
jgi:dTDP-4-dehydrorhamnose reductase